MVLTEGQLYTHSVGSIHRPLFTEVYAASKLNFGLALFNAKTHSAVPRSP